MKTFTFASLLFGTLVAAAPQFTQPGESTVTLLRSLETAGDAASTDQIPFRRLSGELGPAASLLVRGSNNVPISEDQIVCQAFLDSAATKPVGSTFNNAFPVVLAQGDEPLVITWVYCADAAGVAAFTARGQAQQQVQTVRIQLQFSGEGAAQGDVPVNGQVVPNTLATSVANAAFITGQPSQVNCEVFGDAVGSNRLAVLPGNGQQVEFGSNGSDVPVGAFRCAQA